QGTVGNPNEQSTPSGGTGTQSASWVDDEPEKTAEVPKAEKPEWLNPKFADAESQAKAYNELEKVKGKLTQEQRELAAKHAELEEKHGGLQKYFGAPEEFKFDPDLYQKIDEAGKGVLGEFTKFAREN